ncbi:MAG: hypothetical protein ACP5FQ_07905 [Thermoplasmata archaeon]
MDGFPGRFRSGNSSGSIRNRGVQIDRIRAENGSGSTQKQGAQNTLF